MLSLAKSFGASNEQAKDLVTAAADLSAATGKTLEESVRQLGKTFGGFAGELGEVFPQLKELTSEALQSGEAIAIIGERVGGSAQNELRTFSGAVQSTQNAFGDLLEEIGFVITENPVVLGAIGVLRDAFKELSEFVSDNQGELSAFVSRGLKSFASAIPNTIRSFKLFLTPFEGFALGLQVAKQGVAELGNALLEFVGFSPFDGILAGLNNFASGIAAVIDVLLEFSAVRGGLALVGVDVDSLRESVQDLGVSFAQAADETEGTAEQFSMAFQEMRQEALDSGADIQQSFREVEASIDSAANSVEDNFSKRIQDLPDSISTNIEASVAAQVSVSDLDIDIARAIAEQVSEALSEISIEGVAVAGTSFASAVLNGAKGAVNLISTGLGQAIELFAGIPGLGQQLTPIFQTLATSNEEQLRAQVRAFAESIDDIIVTIAENAGVVAEAIAENADVIVEGLVRGIIKGAPKIVAGLIRAQITANQELVKGIIGIFSESLKAEISQAAVDIREDFKAKLIGGVTNVADSFRAVFGTRISALGERLSNVGNEAIAKIKDGFNTFASNLTGALGEFADDVIAIFTEGPAKIQDQFDGLIDNIESSITDTLSAEALRNNFKKLGASMVNELGAAFSSFFSVRNLRKEFENIGTAFARSLDIGGAVDAFKDGVIEAGKEFIKTVTGANAIESGGNAVQEFFEPVTGLFSGRSATSAPTIPTRLTSTASLTR